MTGVLPIIELGRLEALARDLDSWDDVLDFAGKFLQLLPARLGAITAALQKDDQEAAHIALVSLAASSGAVGALQLEHDARLADQEVRAGRMGEARGWSPGLRDDAVKLKAALEALLRPF
ncbi:hypothetical protein [Sinomonas sp. R1AF57]|uniref:hypothetical protein n=1 Tax=Sinomonas sp. R1AF57 TaxID=2020377 RepID=UPI000B5FC36C|nr:hypothetical protein [Sinomonas sp. R1AF57]ASN52621.1 hypothetical protein CGQ25_11465 [Sinomonas sp. R1AF57]